MFSGDNQDSVYFNIILFGYQDKVFCQFRYIVFPNVSVINFPDATVSRLIFLATLYNSYYTWVHPERTNKLTIYHNGTG
jgi:hypothetical protein